MVITEFSLTTLLLKPGPFYTPVPKKREHPDLQLKGLVQSHKLHTTFPSSQIPGCLMGRILLGPCSLSIVVMPPWCKTGSSSDALLFLPKLLVWGTASLLSEQQGALWGPHPQGRAQPSLWRDGSDQNPRLNNNAKKSLNHTIKTMHIKGTTQVQIWAR